MKRISTILLCAAVTLGSLAPDSAQALTDEQKKGLAIALALGLGIAAAKHGGDNWDNDLYGQPFSPSPNVVCMPKPRKCYKQGHLSYRWTRRIFGA